MVDTTGNLLNQQVFFSICDPRYLKIMKLWNLVCLIDEKKTTRLLSLMKNLLHYSIVLDRIGLKTGMNL